MSAGPRASVIVIFDRGGFEPCLSSLLAQTGVDFEIIAVVPDDEARARLPADERVRGLALADRNPAYRRNAAASRARGRYLAFIDDDAAAPPGWLARGVEFLENYPIYAGVGGPNLGPADAAIRERITDVVLSAPLIGAGSRAYRGGGTAADARPGEIHLVNFMVRRDWFDRVNGFNEALGYGGEDTEFIYQTGKFGGRFRFEPELIVHHRRRPFGMPYFRQRFHLRRQSAKLLVAYPGIYVRSFSFWAAALALPGGLALMISFYMVWGPIGVIVPAALYGLAVTVLGRDLWVGRPVLGPIVALVFFLHHAVNLAGFWFGLVEAVVTLPWRVRRRIRRTMDSCAV